MARRRARENRLWLWDGILFWGLVIHGGTALLRLKDLLPNPRSVDFAAFYAAAYALRQGLVPYGLTVDWLQRLQVARQIPMHPPAIYNPVLWPWLLQPLTMFSYPVAASLWLLINLVLLAWCSYQLLSLARIKEAWQRALAIIVILTFGPVVLDISLGQTSVLLLVATLIIGRMLSTSPQSRLRLVALGVAEGIATGAKLFPLAWVSGLILTRKWRFAVAGSLGALLALGMGFLISSEANVQYWRYFLPRRISAATVSVSMDDQSLVAWVRRMTQPQVYQVPGLWTDRRVRVQWEPILPISQGVIFGFSYGLVVLLGIGVALILFRYGPHQATGSFYLWVLYVLLALSHVERYNHVLLLPAMAWLLGRGRRGWLPLSVAYILTAISRLNHLWLIAFPYPLSAILSGAGTCAVIVLGGTLVVQLVNANDKGLMLRSVESRIPAR